jgi:hypothetical protein
VCFVHALSSCSIAVPASLSEPISAELIILHLSGNGNVHRLLPEPFGRCFRKQKEAAVFTARPFIVLPDLF